MHRSLVLFLAAAFGAAALGCGTSRHRHKASEPRGPVPAVCPAPSFEVVDLSQAIHAGVPVGPSGVAFSMKRYADYPDGYRAHELHMGDDVGTHVDAPAHFVEGGVTIERFTAEQLVLQVAVIDVSDKVAQNPDYALSGNDIVDWEDVNGPIPVGGIVLARTGWSKRFGDPARYLNQDAQGVMHFPGFSGDAAALLVERDVAGIGIDTLSLDPGADAEMSTHKQMLKAGKYMIENLTSLDRLPATGAIIIVGVLPIVDGTQAPARVMALLPERRDDPAEEEN
jgi:kynurenine formamidase